MASLARGPSGGAGAGAGAGAAGGAAHKRLAPPPAATSLRLRDLWGVFGYARRALGLVWATSRGVTIALAAGAVLAGLAPIAMAWAGKQLIDAIVAAAASGATADRDVALSWVAVEAGLALVLLVATRLLAILRSLLRAQLGHRINVMILDKALTLVIDPVNGADCTVMYALSKRKNPADTIARALSHSANASLTLVLHPPSSLWPTSWPRTAVGLHGSPRPGTDMRMPPERPPACVVRMNTWSFCSGDAPLTNSSGAVSPVWACKSFQICGQLLAIFLVCSLSWGMQYRSIRSVARCSRATTSAGRPFGRLPRTGLPSASQLIQASSSSFC